MSNHYMAISRGQEGALATDYTFGTASASSTDIELRMADGVNLTRLDVIKALKAFTHALESGATYTNVPPY
jgi:hypothetical protein